MWVHDGSFIYGSADRYEILVYGLRGNLASILRKTIPNRPFTSAMREAYVARIDSTMQSNPQMARPRTDPEDLPFPDSLPAYRRVRTDRDGFLWIQDYALPSDSAVTWSVFDAGGRWVTDVALPQAWQIEDIGREYILAVVTDELDVERVVRYRLSRTK